MTVTGASSGIVASAGILVDSTPPAGGSVEAEGLVGTDGRYTDSTTVHLALNPGSDSGSGVDAGAGKLLRAAAPLVSTEGALDGECGTYGSYAQVGPDGPGTTVSDIVPADEHCYRYQYRVPDNAGNLAIYTSGEVKVDEFGPINSALPAISGSPQEGGALSASPGTWLHGPAAYAYLWERCGGDGSACSPIPGATARGYSPTSEDVGDTLRVIVAATNASGSMTATSDPSSSVVVGAPANTAAPSITGPAQQGETLTAHNGSWSNSPTGYTYQWQDCNSLGASCAAIEGATQSTYTPQAADIEQRIRVTVTATNGGGSTPATSGATASVLIEAPVNTAAPSITGTTQQGETLTAADGAWSNSPAGYTYQWARCNSEGKACGPISGATSAGYTVAESEVGQTLRLIVTATNAGGSREAESPAVGLVGTFSEFSKGITASANLRAITAGPHGNLWFTEGNSNKIGKITTAGTVTEYTEGISSASHPRGITVGPDGNLWFTEYGVPEEAGVGNRIGKMTTAGAVTEYSEGISPESHPLSIAEGPENNLWFTEAGGNRIGQITTSGKVTEHEGITGGSVPFGITAGPDGNVWFTEKVGNRIGRITPTAREGVPAGTVTEFELPAPGSEPSGIAAGADGNLWFTESKGNRIGKITPTGSFTQYPLPNPGSGPEAITAGPEGDLWFTEKSGNRIGRITTAGVVTEFSAGMTAGSGPEGIAVGPDGNVWFTENTGNRVGRLAIGGPVNTVLPLVSGTATPGQTLSLTNGSWTGAPTPTYTYQWQDCNSLGEACVVIAGASGASYTIAESDRGHAIRGVVSGTSSRGSATAVSLPTSAVPYAPPVNTAAPVISGTAQQNKVLSTTNGGWTGEGLSYTYQWEDCNSAGTSCAGIEKNSTASTYTPAATDVGKTLRVIVTAKNTGGSEMATSEKTASVLVTEAPADTVLPVITGTAKQGETLTSTKGTWSNFPTGYTYQWEDCNSLGEACVAIKSTNKTSYLLAATDVGKTLRILVTAKNEGGTGPVAESLPTGLVAGP